MTDEEVLKIAQGLSPDDWDSLFGIDDGENWYEPELDDHLIARGLLVRDRYVVHTTEMWPRVRMWHPLFW